MNKLNPDPAHKFNAEYFDRMYMLDVLHEKHKMDKLTLHKLQQNWEYKDLREKAKAEELVTDTLRDTNKEVQSDFETIYAANDDFEGIKSEIQSNKPIIDKTKVDKLIRFKKW